jgi:hypothetical protein
LNEPLKTPSVVEASVAKRPRAGVPHRYVWYGLVALALVILAVFGVGYWVLVRYEPVAVRHVPGSALAAVRVDVEQVVLYEPVRKHLFPVLDGGPSSAHRLQRFKEASGVNLGMDLREIVAVALPDGETLFLVGGLFPKSGLAAAIDRVIRESPKGAGACALAAQRLRCPGLVVGQADDGVLVIARSERGFEAATTGSDWSERAGLPAAPLAMVAALPPEFMRMASGALALAPWLRRVERLTVSADLGDPLEVEASLSGLGSDAVSEVRGSLEILQQLAAANPGADRAGERAVLARATVAEKDGRPVVRSQWTRAEVDRAMRSLADVLATALEP